MFYIYSFWLKYLYKMLLLYILKKVALSNIANDQKTIAVVVYHPASKLPELIWFLTIPIIPASELEKETHPLVTSNYICFDCSSLSSESIKLLADFNDPDMYNQIYMPEGLKTLEAIKFKDIRNECSMTTILLTYIVIKNDENNYKVFFF